MQTEGCKGVSMLFTHIYKHCQNLHAFQTPQVFSIVQFDLIEIQIIF